MIRLGFAAAIAACFAVLVGGTACAADGPPATVYRHAWLIDGSGGPMRPGMSVLVEGERIKWVAPDAEMAVPTGARVVDLTGKYLLPGLIDSHEHLATPPNRRQAEANMRRDIYGGVTAIRDMADDLRAVAELTRASRAAEIPGPDIYYAALMAGPSFFDDPRTHAATFGVTPGKAPWMQSIDETTDMRTAVTLAKGTSATAIKIYANLPADLVSKIAAEAHRQGLLVWAHTAVYPATPSQVLAARPDAVSHACGLGHEVAGTPQTYQSRTPMDPAPYLAGDNPTIAKLLQTMKAQGTILDATGSIYAEHSEQLASKNPKAKPSLCSGAMSDALIRQAWRAGVAVSSGTDWVAPWDDPWPTLYHELAALVRIGMSPGEVIHAATLVGARAAGQEPDMGSIAPGKLADMIVLTRDPLADIQNLKSLELTIKRGRTYRRADFKPLTKQDLED
ncbi:amidohydrolase family protein [Phenylobacterium sp.]|jgi:imidazolonepropionase-like amidohydrolase|uniref:amidohydrolase family protein n=1 Tax=Phenylobacterium sp. TaxID=1871053 RepID=UPI002F427F51